MPEGDNFSSFDSDALGEKLDLFGGDLAVCDREAEG